MLADALTETVKRPLVALPGDPIVIAYGTLENMVPTTDCSDHRQLRSPAKHPTSAAKPKSLAGSRFPSFLGFLRPRSGISHACGAEWPGRNRILRAAYADLGSECLDGLLGLIVPYE